MHHIFSAALARDRIAELHQQAMARSLRPTHHRGRRNASLRLAVGRWLVLLGWRLLDAGLQQTHRLVR